LQRFPEIERPVGEGDGPYRGPNRVTQISADFHNHCKTVCAGDVEPKLIVTNAETAVPGLDQRVPEQGRTTGKSGTPTGVAKQIKDRRVIVRDEPRHINGRSVALEIKTGQAGTALERTVSDVIDAAWNRDVAQVKATREHISTNTGNAGGDCDVCQAGAVLERVVSDVREATRHYEAGQAGAVTKRIITDAGDAVRNRDVRQVGAVKERIISNVGDAVGNRDVSQAGAVTKRVVSDATLPGIVTLARLEQPEKTSTPILVTPLGIVTLVRPSQPVNAESPMLVTLPGIMTFVRLVQL